MLRANLYTLFLQLAAAAVLLAAGPTVAEESARTQLENFLAGTSTYTARFSQVVTDERDTVVEEGEGQFWLARPGQFRWLYESPLERELVSDGDRIWLYDVELDQVTVRSADGALAQTPAGILVGEPGALDNYILSLRDESLPGTRIGLQPKSSGGDFEDIVVEIDGDDLAGLLLRDRFGQTTRIRFDGGERNLKVPEGMFQFVAPDGVDIIDQTL